MKMFITTIASCLALCASASAQMPFVLLQHAGGNDPTTEGFTKTGTPPGGPAVGNSWKINDNSTSSDLRYTYAGSGPFNNLMTLTQQAYMAQPGHGWYMTLSVDVLSAPNLIFGAPRVVYSTWSVDNDGVGALPSQRYNLIFGRDAGGNMQLDWDPMFDGANATLVGSSHTIQFRNKGGINATELYVDGALIPLTTVTGSPDSQNFLFGSIVDGDTGESNWALAQFYVAPEPTATVLTLLAGGLLARMRRRHL